MNKILMFLASCVSETPVNNPKDAAKLLGVLVIAFLVLAWLHDAAKHNPAPVMEGIPSNALAQ
jgi:hypothetical protein